MTRVASLTVAIVLALAVTAAPRGARHRAKPKHPPTPAWKTSRLWSEQTSPASGPARSIGATNAGCLQGGVALPAAGPGFELLHLGRHRYFGHPALVDYVRRLAAAALAKHFPPLLVGDLSQARGGPTPSDHGSHQSGLDVDIAYTRPPDALVRLLDPAERETVTFTPIVDLATSAPTPAWPPRLAELLELAASEPAVDRIFVNPAVKRELCSGDGRGSAWLARLRPWWGHHDHFHVRLKCPSASGTCKPPPPLPPGDGCDETLAWWFGPGARAAAARRSAALPSIGTRGASLPATCRRVLDSRPRS